MPVPSIFKRKRPKQPVSDAFNADDGLLQLHNETAELLRLVKTPAPRRSNASSASNASPLKRPVRQTIEVLEDDEDEDDDKAGTAAARTSAPAEPRPPPESDPPTNDDPFAFDAEEARVRVASDTFLPHTSPAKRAVERQRGHLSDEHARLARIERRAELAQQTRAREAEGRVVVNRVEDSAIKIQAHSRGFLARKHADDDKKKQEDEAERERVRLEAASWHEVRDVERGDVWFYNAVTGQSQWERPAAMAASHSLPELPGPQSPLAAQAASTGGSSTTILPRVGATSNDQAFMPPLSPSTSRPSSSSSSAPPSRPPSAKRTSLLPALSVAKPTTSDSTNASARGLPSTSSPWECDSVADSASDLASLYSERLEDDEPPPTEDFSRGRRASLPESPHQTNGEHDDDDWQINDALFLADGSKNSKLRDTIRQALQTSKFDSVSSLVASNVVLRRKPVKGRRQAVEGEGSASPNQRSGVPRGREIVLGRRDAPMFVAVLDKAGKQPSQAVATRSPAASTSKAKIKQRPRALPLGSDPDNPLASAPQIRDLVDPGLYEDLRPAELSSPSSPPKQGGSPEKAAGATTICFNCWSSSNGRHCDAHVDASDLRKIKSAESALMCANWKLDQLRRKYRAEEIQEIFMKQNASLRYDKRLKQYVTVIEARHPIYRLTEHLATSWSKTMRRKLHTRAWFRSFIEQLRAGAVPKADAATPKLMKLKNTLQNNRWCSKYSDSVRAFHPTAPVTSKTQSGERRRAPLDIILIDPARPQLGNWILKTDCTKPVELYKPRKYELPPRRCVPMPTPSFLEDIPLPVPNIFIDCGHIASWFERLSARIASAAANKALLQIRACSPPRGATDARRTKHVTPVVVLFATFGRKPTNGMLAVGGLSAELLIHMLVTTYIPAQYGHFIVFDRRAITPQPTKDHDAAFVCLEIDAKTMEYVYRALEHALNVRRPPCITIATRSSSSETHELALRRFPANRPEQTGEELAHGFRTFWLVDAFIVPDEVACVSVEPTADVLSPNVASMNATQTTKADRFYPFCIATTKENTPIEFIHLLWIGQSSRNQPQTFTTLGAQQPGEFMKNSDPNGALGVCTSVIYRSWAYMQSSPYEEFCTDDGVAYWYDKQNGDTFWSRPVLPVEKHRGKDGDIDGVIVHGQGEVATLGVGVDEARYKQHDLRKYMTKKMEAPEEKDKRIQRVAASARKHDLVVTLESSGPTGTAGPTDKRGFATVQVPKLEFRKKSGVAGATTAAAVPAPSPVKSVSSPQKTQQQASTRDALSSQAEVDASTKQLIASITQALGSALPSGAAGSSGVDMLQLGIGLGMGLGLRSQQQNLVTSTQRRSSRAGSSRSTRSTRPRSADSQVTFAEDIDEGDEYGDEEGDDDALLATTRSDESGHSDGSSTGRSVMSVATSVDVTPSPDELELLPEAERAKLLSAGHGRKTPGYRTHPPPGEGRTWVDKPIDASAESQTAVEGFGGSLHQRVACLPKDFVAAVNTTKTCKMQANYLPVIKNTNQPRSVGIVRPRPALDEWLPVGYSPWSAGRSIFGTQFIKNLMQRPELVAAQKSGASSIPGAAAGGASSNPAVQVEKKENVTQAVKEAQQLETVFSLCRHGKYDDLERMITSPDWTLDIEAKDVTGNTLLSIACQNNNKRIAKLCLRRGADINTQNLNGQTVLHYCHEYGFHDLMDYLLDKGARDDVVNADGLTCYEGLSKEAVDAI